MSADSQPPSGYKLCPQCRQIYPASVELCPRDHARLIIERRIVVGKYILLNRLGSSSGSEVFAAEQPQLGRMVTIKLLARDPDVEAQFDSQVRSIGAVKHEHAVTLYDSGRAEDGRPYIAMEYLEGENLAARLVRTGAIAGNRALILWRQAVSAIAAAHRRHIVHGDINPTNLFLTHRESEAGPEEIIKVINFHIGPRPAAPELDSAPRGAGLTPYAAPEQLKSGQMTTRSDVYSLGLVLLEMLNGRLPRESTGGGKEEVSQALLLQLGQSQPGLGSLRGLLSSDLLTLLGDVLRRDPARRPADAGALLQLIRRLPDVGPLPPSSGGIRIAEVSASQSPPPSQSTEPDWLAGAKTAKDKNSAPGVASPPPPAEISSSAFVPGDVLETPDMGIEIAEPPWLTGTQEQKIMALPKAAFVPTVETGPTVITKSSEEERDDPVLGSETPQMGVAALSVLLSKIKEREHLSDHEHDPVPAAPVPAAPVPVAPVRPPMPWTRVALRIFFVVLIFGGLGGGLALLARTNWPRLPGSVFRKTALGVGADGAVSPASAPVADLLPPDLTVSAEPAGRNVGGERPGDLGTADAASAKGDTAAGPIKIRFLYDEDAVTSIECNQDSLVAPNSAEKHSAGVEAILRPGGFCRASGPRGSKTYKYETLFQKRPDSTAVRRIRIRMGDPEGDQPAPAPAPAAKNPNAPTPEPLPKPPAPPPEGGGS